MITATTIFIIFMIFCIFGLTSSAPFSSSGLRRTHHTRRNLPPSRHIRRNHPRRSRHLHIHHTRLPHRRNHRNIIQLFVCDNDSICISKRRNHDKVAIRIHQGTLQILNQFCCALITAALPFFWVHFPR